MKNSPKNDLFFQDYLIIFFDLIGQRETLQKIKAIPVSDPEKREFLELVKKSAGRVLFLRDSFKNYFSATLSHVPNTSLVPPEHRQEFIQSQKTNLHYYGLSDAIVIAVPLMNENENCTAINGVFSALTATCAIKLLALSVKIPARAGIDVGVGVQIDDREVYGPALERAVHIEAELAEYPRLVVGRELHAYLSWVENQHYQNRLGEIASNLAKQCRKLMVQDTDGLIILDYLGKNIREVFENQIEPEIVVNAWNYVKEQHMQYLQLGDEKLASRYFRMMRYFRSRLPSWGIEEERVQHGVPPDGFATR
jgi:hypothetical protein